MPGFNVAFSTAVNVITANIQVQLALASEVRTSITAKLHNAVPGFRLQLGTFSVTQASSALQGLDVGVSCNLSLVPFAPRYVEKAWL